MSVRTRNQQRKMTVMSTVKAPGLAGFGLVAGISGSGRGAISPVGWPNWTDGRTISTLGRSALLATVRGQVLMGSVLSAMRCSSNRYQSLTI